MSENSIWTNLGLSVRLARKSILGQTGKRGSMRLLYEVLKTYKIVRLVDQAVELAGELKTAIAEGTIEEKRLFLRAFLKRIGLDLTKGVGRAMFILLPGMGKAVKEGCSMMNEVKLQSFINV